MYLCVFQSSGYIFVMLSRVKAIIVLLRIACRPGKTDPKPETRTEQPESIPEPTSEMKQPILTRTSEVIRPITEPNPRFDMNRSDPHPK